MLRLLSKEFKLFFNDKVAVSLTFFVPVVLIYIFGSIFGADSTPSGIKIAFLNESSSPIASSIEQDLDSTSAFRIIKKYKMETGLEVPFDTTTIKEFVRTGKATAAVVLPKDMLTDSSFGLKIKFYFDPKNEMEMQMAQGMLRQILFKQVPNYFSQSLIQGAERFLGKQKNDKFFSDVTSVLSNYFGDTFPEKYRSPDSLKKSFETGTVSTDTNILQRVVRVESQQLVGADIKNPMLTRSVGGWALMFLLFSLSGSATSLFDEKKNGVVVRILASPVSRLHILWSKYLVNMIIGFIQLLFLFVAGWLMFRIDVFSNIANLLLVIVAAACACTAFGMMLAAFTTSAAQASGWATFLILTMSAVGGAWFPASFMPASIQFFSKLTIVYWAMEGFVEVLWRHTNIVAILPKVGVLLLVAFVVNMVSIWKFKKGRVF